MQRTRNDVITMLAETPMIVGNLTANLGEEALDYRPEPGDWTVREILAHLVDDEMYVMRTRLERIVKEDMPDLAPHDEQKWYANRNTTRDELHQLLADFALQRAASMNIISMLREEDLAREGYQPEYGRFSVETWLHHWADHDTIHINQIKSNLLSYAHSQGISAPANELME